MTPQQILEQGFSSKLSFRERRPGMIQIMAPIFHEDGDMIDLFLDLRDGNPNQFRLTDGGLTLMRLSYSFDIDTPNKERILNKILSENGITLKSGEMTLTATRDNLLPQFLHFAQVIAKVTSLQFLKRQVISSLFYEMLAEFVHENLAKYSPMPRYFPIEDRQELEVDWMFPLPKRPIYLFGVKDSPKARLAAISCLEFQKHDIPFRSIAVHEDFEDGLNKSDQRIITNAADKQFTSLQDFVSNGRTFFEREAA